MPENFKYVRQINPTGLTKIIGMLGQLNLLLLLFVLMIETGSAQTGDTTVHLPVVEVTAGRIEGKVPGRKIQSLDSILKVQATIQNLDNLLMENTTLQIKQYNFGGLSTISFRGTGAEHTGLYWNGFELNACNNGLVDLSLVPAGYFNNIKILYGGSSSMFGSGNIGGSIHLNTLPEFLKQKSGSFSLSGGSFDQYSASGNVQISNEKVYSKTQVIGKTAHNDFPYTDLNGQRQEMKNAAVKQYGVMQDLYFRINRKTIAGGAVWYQKNDRKLPSSITAKPADASQSDNSLRSMVSLQHYYNRLNKITFRAAWFLDDYQYSDPDLLSAGVEATNIKSRKFTPEILFEHHFSSKLQLEAGLTFIYKYGQSKSWADNAIEKTLGLFTSISRQFPEIDWVLSVNLRQNFTEGYHVPFTPSIAMEGRIWKFVFGRFNASGNFRVPTFNERFWIPGGNENLKPEHAINQEVGVYILPIEPNEIWDGKFGVTLYNSNVNDWIHWVPVGSYSQPENISKVWSRGLELTGMGKLSKGKVDFMLEGGYTYALSTNKGKTNSLDDSFNKQLVFVPKHRFYLNFAVELKKFTLAYNQQYTGERFTSSDNLEFLAPYTTGKFRAGKEFTYFKTNFFCQFEIYNVWDVDYETIRYFPMPGRYYLGLLTIKF